MSKPVLAPRASTPGLTEVLGEIARLEELEEEWDLDGARRIDGEAIRLASQIVRAVEDAAWEEGVAWQSPEIGPVPDGSVALTWEGNQRQTLLICRPGQSAAVECVTKEGEGQPVLRIGTEAEAVRSALWTLGGR